MTMQTIRPSQVPEYLRDSKFFLGLNVEVDDEFAIPSNHMKMNINVYTLADMTELLNTIRFWGVEIFPETMINFAARRKFRDIKSVLEPYREDLHFICVACSIVFATADNEKRLEKAMDCGNIDMVKYFYKQGGNFTIRAIALAAGKGALDCLQYAMSFKTVFADDSSIFCEAVRNGHLDCILFLHQKGFSLHRYLSFYENGVKRVDLAELAASSGQCAVLTYLNNQGYPIHAAAVAAADANHFDCLRYAMEKGARFGYEYNPTGTLAQRLARKGLLQFFPLALSHVGQIDAQTTLNFAKAKNWEMFKLCIQYIVRPSLDLVFKATEKGYVDCLQRLHQVCVSEVEANGHGFSWLTYATSNSISSSLNPNDLAKVAIKGRRWECLRFLITHDCPMTRCISTALLYARQMELYHLATSHGCEVSVQAACLFARDGNVDLLQHALEHGCERSEEILRVAARCGQLECLMHAHAQGCPWSSQVTLAAARGGHQVCLQYLNEHGCPLHARTEAFKRKYVDLG